MWASLRMPWPRSGTWSAKSDLPSYFTNFTIEMNPSTNLPYFSEITNVKQAWRALAICSSVATVSLHPQRRHHQQQGLEWGSAGLRVWRSDPTQASTSSTLPRGACTSYDLACLVRDDS